MLSDATTHIRITRRVTRCRPNSFGWSVCWFPSTPGLPFWWTKTARNPQRLITILTSRFWHYEPAGPVPLNIFLREEAKGVRWPRVTKIRKTNALAQSRAIRCTGNEWDFGFSLDIRFLMNPHSLGALYCMEISIMGPDWRTPRILLVHLRIVPFKSLLPLMEGHFEWQVVGRINEVRARVARSLLTALANRTDSLLIHRNCFIEISEIWESILRSPRMSSSPFNRWRELPAFRWVESDVSVEAPEAQPGFKPVSSTTKKSLKSSISRARAEPFIIFAYNLSSFHQYQLFWQKKNHLQVNVVKLGINQSSVWWNSLFIWNVSSLCQCGRRYQH
jgi:hypothetical protein